MFNILFGNHIFDKIKIFIDLVLVGSPNTTCETRFNQTSGMNETRFYPGHPCCESKLLIEKQYSKTIFDL